MFTVWPWPGVTAWAVVISALTTKKSLPITGTHPGSLSRWWSRMYDRDEARDQDQPDDRDEVQPVLADGRLHFVPSPGPLAAAGPLMFGGLLL